MGICSSCLGLARRSSDAERSDSSHLLGDPYQPHYGSINHPSAHSLPQPDPEEIRRQRDALERICAQTSDKLIHVSQAAYTDDSHHSEYLRLFNERFPPMRSASPPPSARADYDQDEATWLSNVVGSSNDAEGSWERVEPIESGALTIQFGEALSDRKR
ncbi:uncharacterized protein N0V89_008302 [Didymosphaeria variabile]|uniref:Late endosomal/lysosomal adaptor and MAPK and MTOR activator domain-containing protein n=1 Tax=Didymosphaeria variabile TaxID=1932322 RepID=A0A9W9C7P2_9PLEO|nr:uncharacterized protein N0V89_008302 [Didymosphaeria variabile]KAJ4349685.1 hypothetical protein N0V89_008302 [Didymosphaeria variabile]